MLHAPIHRLFFAIRPPVVLARQVVSAAHWFDIGDTLLRPEHLHLTLDLLDDRARADAALIADVRAIGGAVAADPFAIVLDRVVGSGRSIALRPSRRVAALDLLAHEIARQRGRRGIAARDGYRFAAHMTLGYRDGAPFQQAVTPVTWQVDAFELVLSHVGRTRHERIGRWRLHGGDPEQGRLL